MNVSCCLIIILRRAGTTCTLALEINVRGEDCCVAEKMSLAAALAVFGWNARRPLFPNFFNREQD